MKDRLEVIRRTALKALRHEKDDLTVKTVRVDSMIAAFDGVLSGDNTPKKRKMSAAWRRAISNGIRKSARLRKNGKTEK